MKSLLRQMSWQFVLLARNSIITISIAVTVIYALLFFALRHLNNMDKVLTLMILNDPAIIGMFFIGLGIIMEKKQEVLSALFVTPVNHHVYLLSRIIPLSIVAGACALGMAFSALGASFHLFHFSVGAFGLSVLSCLGGIFLVCYTMEFMQFILRSVPLLLLVINLPLLNYFQVTDIHFFDFSPVQGCLNLLIHSYDLSLPNLTVIFSYISIVVWIVLLYWLVYRTFLAKIVNS